MRAVILAFTFFFAFFVSGSLMAQDREELIKSLKGLSDKLEAADTVDGQLETALKDLATVVDGLLAKSQPDIETQISSAAVTIRENLTNGGIADEVEALRGAVFEYEGRDRNAFIVTLKTALKAAVDASSASSLNDTAKAAIFGLKPMIETLERAAPQSAIQTRSTELNGLINGFTPVKSGDIHIAELTTLLETLRMVEGVRYLSALTTRIDSLGSLLGTDTLSKEEIQKVLSREHFKKLATLNGKISTILGDEDRRTGIHVVSARWGRTSGQSRAGFCDAKQAVVNACQGQGSCNLDAATFPRLCGGQDPAPFVDGAHKGVTVTYRCLFDQPIRVWNELFQGDSVPVEGRIKTAILRSEHDAFKCAVEGD